jgi:hypothetical protein
MAANTKRKTLIRCRSGTAYLNIVRVIGPAVWEFFWLLDKITSEDTEGVGWCLGRSPIKAQDIAKDLKESPETTRDNLTRLDRYGYIKRVRTPYGWIIGVLNSCKFDIWKAPVPQGSIPATDSYSRSDSQSDTTRHNRKSNDSSERVGENSQSEKRELEFSPERVGENPHYKEDTARHSKEELHVIKFDKPIRSAIAERNGFEGLNLPPEPPKTKRHADLAILNALQVNSKSREWPAEFDEQYDDASTGELTSALYGWITWRVQCRKDNVSIDSPLAYAIQSAREFFDQHFDDWFQILERFLGFVEDNGFTFNSRTGTWFDTREVPISVPRPPKTKHKPPKLKPNRTSLLSDAQVNRIRNMG